MHIAIDLHDILNVGGLEKVVTGVAVEMAIRGHTVTAFTHSPTSSHASFKSPDNLTLQFYTFSGDSRTIPEIQNMLCRINPDVFISPSSFNNVILWAAALQGTDVPLLYSEHSNPWRIEEERWDKAERQAVLWAADSVHLLTESYLEAVPPLLRAKCRIIGNPISQASHQPSETPHPPCLLSLGRFAKLKQIPLLVQTFALLAPDFPPWELHIWGAGEEEKSIRKAIAEAHCPQIYLHGLTLQPEQQFAQADIFCIPSRFEGFPIAVLEAFSQAIPVVGFADCSGVNSLVHSGYNGLLAESMTVESLATCLRQLMSSYETRQRMGKAARITAQKYAPEYIYDQWEQLLQIAASRKGNTQLSRLYQDELLSPEEETWRNTMREILRRPNVLLQNRQIFRRFLRRHPSLKNIIKKVIRKF